MLWESCKNNPNDVTGIGRRRPQSAFSMRSSGTASSKKTRNSGKSGSGVPGYAAASSAYEDWRRRQSSDYRKSFRIGRDGHREHLVRKKHRPAKAIYPISKKVLNKAA